MKEGIQKPETIPKEEYLRLAGELSQHEGGFKFPGINADDYSELRTTEDPTGNGPTPIDVLLERFEKEGMKIVVRKNSLGESVYVLPLESNTIEADALLPSYLKDTPDTDPEIRSLIAASKHSVS